MDAAAKLEKAIKTGDTKAFAEVFGKKAVTPENMSKLGNTMKSMVSALRDHGKLGYTAFGVTKAYFAGIHKPSDTIARSLPDGKGLQINVQHSGFNDAYQLSWTAAHESGHPFGLRDNAYKFGGEGQAPGAYQNLSPARALENADSVVDYAFR